MKAVYVSLWSQHCYRLWREEFMHRMQGIRVSSRADRHTVHWGGVLLLHSASVAWSWMTLPSISIDFLLFGYLDVHMMWFREPKQTTWVCEWRLVPRLVSFHSGSSLYREWNTIFSLFYDLASLKSTPGLIASSLHHSPHYSLLQCNTTKQIAYIVFLHTIHDSIPHSLIKHFFIIRLLIYSHTFPFPSTIYHKSKYQTITIKKSP